MLLVRPLAVAGALGLALAGTVSDACAQQIFKIVGPDGRITFSDKPPTDTGVKAEAAKVVPISQGGATDLASLPFDLRQAASRYPVTLYSSPGCGTCAQGRQFLTTRGVPFAEKTVSSREDIDALGRLAGTQSVPLLTIGSQQLKGYSDTEWAEFLDAAGYPKTSQLPPSYIAPAATPLVALEQRNGSNTAPGNDQNGRRPQRPVAPPAQPTAPVGDNPAGITF